MLELTDPHGDELYLRGEFLESISPANFDDEASTYIVSIGTSGGYYVQESVQEVKLQLEEDLDKSGWEFDGF